MSKQTGATNMNKQTEAMKLACKALRDCHYYMINAGLPNQSLLNEAFTAYKELEAALAEQPAQQNGPWCMKMNDCKTKCEDCPDEVAEQQAPLFKPLIDLHPGLAEEMRAMNTPAQQEPVGEVSRYGLDSHVRKWHGIHWYDPNVDVPHGTKLYTSPPAQPQPTIYVDPDAIRLLLDPDYSGVVTAQLTRHKPDPLRGPKVGLSITKGST